MCSDIPRYPYTFTLLAPHQNEAMIQLDVLDWEKQPMQKNEAGVFYWNTELPDGTYRYRFHLPSQSWFYDENTWLDVIDPLATEVDEAEGVAIVHLAQGMPVHSNYAWQADTVEQLPPHTWVLYEMHVGIFANTFQGCLEKLPYLQTLGITALQLLPVQAFPGENSLGYNPAYFLAPDPTYGTPEDLMQFVDHCHERQIVCLGDFIFNHASPESPLAQIDHDYWFHHEAKDPDQSWGPEFNYDFYDEEHQRYPAWEYAQHIIEHWLYNYHLDGLRYDAVKQINHRPFLDWVTQQAHFTSGPKRFFNIAECIPDEPSMVAQGGPMNSCWHDSFCHEVRRFLAGEAFDMDALYSALDGTQKGYETPLQMVNYLSNHDQPRMHSYLLAQGLSEEEALLRHELGVALLFFAVGIPMVRMGEEMAWHTDDADETQLHLPWDRLEQEAVGALFRCYQQWIHWRKEKPALQQGALRWLATEPLWWLVREHEGQAMLLILNPGETPQPLPNEQDWPTGDTPWQILAGEEGLNHDGALLPWQCLIFENAHGVE